MCKDEYCEWVLVRYLDADKTITRNKLLRVNIKYYYTETRYPFGEQEPFFDYCVDLDKGKYYWLMKSRGAVHANKHCH